MLFGCDRVSDRIHLLATVLVAVGTTVSAFWITRAEFLDADAGRLRDDRRPVHAADWWPVVFNPSLPYRLVHMLLGLGADGCRSCIAGVWALATSRRSCGAHGKGSARRVFAAAVLIPVQIFTGDQHGLNTLEHQPAKIAAMEAIWHTGRGVPLLLFAWPDGRTGSNRFAIEIPKRASLILTHRPTGELGA